jgi:hypothetical protein
VHPPVPVADLGVGADGEGIRVPVGERGRARCCGRRRRVGDHGARDQQPAFPVAAGRAAAEQQGPGRRDRRRPGPGVDGVAHLRPARAVYPARWRGVEGDDPGGQGQDGAQAAAARLRLHRALRHVRVSPVAPREPQQPVGVELQLPAGILPDDDGGAEIGDRAVGTHVDVARAVQPGRVRTRRSRARDVAHPQAGRPGRRQPRAGILPESRPRRERVARRQRVVVIDQADREGTRVG